MSEKTREICTVVSQESIGAGIYSMWIQTDRIAADAKPGQFVSLYTNDKSKILPRPISLCEIDKENGRLHLVYRVTGQGTGTDEFSQMKAGDTIPVLGPLGNGFPVEKAEGKKVFLMGGGIGVPPILELAKQGKTILINTLEIPEIQKVADYCAVFYNGEIIKVLEHQEIDEMTVMMYSTNAAQAEEGK